MIKHLSLMAALLVPILAYSANPSAPFSDQVVPATQPPPDPPPPPSPGSIACDVGPNVSSIPAPAQAAGFTHCVLNADFTSTTTDSHGVNFSNLATFVNECGASSPTWTNGVGPGRFFLFYSGSGSAASCSYLSITSDGAAPQVLHVHLGGGYGTGSQYQQNTGAGGDGNYLELQYPVRFHAIGDFNIAPTFPNEMYAVVTFRNTASSYVTAPGSHTIPLDFWDTSYCACQAEIDFFEVDNGVSSTPPYSYGGNGITASVDSTQYHTFGYLDTSDEATAVEGCLFIDGTFQSCGLASTRTNFALNVSTPPGLPQQTGYTQRENTVNLLIGGYKCFNSGPTQCITNDQDYYIKNIQVFECSSFGNGCPGAIINHWPFSTGNSLTGITLSNAQFTCGTSGTVGAITVQGTGSISGATLSLSGADAGQFSLSSTTVPSNLTVGGSPAGCPRSYNVNVVATLTGATGSPFTQGFTITGNAATANQYEPAGCQLGNHGAVRGYAHVVGNTMVAEDGCYIVQNYASGPYVIPGSGTQCFYTSPNTDAAYIDMRDNGHFNTVNASIWLGDVNKNDWNGAGDPLTTNVGDPCTYGVWGSGSAGNDMKLYLTNALAAAQRQGMYVYVDLGPSNCIFSEHEQLVSDIMGSFASATNLIIGLLNEPEGCGASWQSAGQEGVNIINNIIRPANANTPVSVLNFGCVPCGAQDSNSNITAAQLSSTLSFINGQVDFTKAMFSFHGFWDDAVPPTAQFEQYVQTFITDGYPVLMDQGGDPWGTSMPLSLFLMQNGVSCDDSNGFNDNDTQYVFWPKD